MIKLYLKSLKVLHIKFTFAPLTANTRRSHIFNFPPLQSQIASKLKEILNVIEMLNGIIGKDEKKSGRKSKKSESDSSPERIKTELLESMKRKKKEAEEK